MRNIDNIREITHAAAGKWLSLLAGLSIDAPDSPCKHTACPSCGGKNYFRLDDNGRGGVVCNQYDSQKVGRCGGATEFARPRTDPVINAIANLYARQLLEAVSATSGNESYFYIAVDYELCRMDVSNAQDMRELLDDFLINDLLERPRHINIGFLADCVGRDEPTELGYKVWFSVLEKIGVALSAAGGFDE